MIKMVRNLLRLARITKAGDDTGRSPVQQMEYLGKTADGVIVFPYGMHANVPADTAALMMALQGNAENRFALPFNTSDRPKLADGEVAFFHPLLPDMIIKLQANGKMLIKSGVSVDVDAPEATFSGNVTITGNLEVTGTTTLGTTVTSNGVNIGETHVHTQANDSGGNTEANTGVPQ